MLARVRLTSASAPNGLAAADGAVWSLSHRGTTAFRIDPRIDRVVAKVDIGQLSCGQPLGAYHEIWAQPCDSSTTTIVLDASTNTVRGSINDAGGNTLAAGFGSVWIANYEETSVKRIDPRSLKLLAAIHVSSGNLAVGDHSVWSAGLDSAGDGNGTLAKIDPMTNRLIARYRIPRCAGPFMTYADGALWLKANNSSKLFRFDPATGETTASRLPGWHMLSQFYDQPIAAGADSLWIRVNDGTVARLNPTDGRVTAQYPADANAGGGYPLVAFGSLWVANFGADTVWRDRLTAPPLGSR